MPRLVSPEELEAARPLLQQLVAFVHVLATGSVPDDELRQLIEGEPHHLTDEIVNGVLAHAEFLRLSGEAKPARATAALLLSLVESREDYRNRWWRQAALWYVRCSTTVLAEDPGVPLFARTLAVADGLVAACRQDGDQGELFRALLASAVLRHDPLVLGAYPLHEWLDDESARRRQWSQLGSVDANEVETVTIPHPINMLDEAYGCAREVFLAGISPEALAVGSGALAAMKQLGVADVSDEAVAGIARPGLGIVDRQAIPAAYLLLLRALQSTAEPLELDRRALVPVDYAGLVAQGQSIIAYLLIRLAFEIAFLAHRPDLIRDLLTRSRPVLPSHGQDRLRQVVWEAQVHSLGPDPGRRWPADELALRREANQWRPFAKRVRHGKRGVSRALIHVAAHMLEAGAIDQAVDLLDESWQLDPALLKGPDGPAIVFLNSRARYAAGRDLEKAGRHANAASLYAAAVAGYADLRLEQRTLEGLLAIDRCIERGGLQASLGALPLVGKAVIELGGYAVGDPEWSIQQLCRHACGDLPNDVSALGMLILLHQVAKARVFHVAATNPIALALDEAEQALVDAAARAEAVQDEPAPADAPFKSAGLHGELIMADDLWTGEPVHGAGKIDPAATIQRAFDHRHHTRLAWQGEVWKHRYLRADEILARLPEHTVLLSLYVGTGDGARLTAVAFTRRETRASVFELGFEGWVLGPGFRVSPLSWQCAQLRQAIRDDPLFRVVSREAEGWLTGDLRRWLGFGDGALDEWRSEGYDHLCIWPNGPLHFAPFHLLSPGGAPLADHWTVTTLPSLASLASTREPSRADRAMMSVASPNGGSRYGLPREDAVVQQATTVASLFGERPLIGDEATRQRFLDEIEHVRYVHVAAHGSHTESAPSFQCIYLGGGSTDERVYPHDIIGRDLGNVDMVTFSACESALGRFDQGDNLRGLLESVFVTGASSMVGCLWPVHPDVAGAFFERMYGALADRRPRLASFRAAQQETRAQFPQYRDWGAFCFMGDWREPDGGEM